MQEKDKRYIEDIIRDRKTAHVFYEKNSGVYRAFTKMEEAAFSDGALARRQKELIAIGISVVINCESCMEWHIQQALLAGAKREEVLEAIGVGLEMGGGPATVAGRFALKALEYHDMPRD